MTGPLSALPVVPESALPRAVREGSPESREAYRAALGFERLFVEQLLKTSKAGGAAVEGPQGAAVQDAMADAMLAGGGFGLAGQLHLQMKGRT